VLVTIVKLKECRLGDKALTTLDVNYVFIVCIASCILQMPLSFYMSGIVLGIRMK
jgi:hypothetical protein